MLVMVASLVATREAAPPERSSCPAFGLLEAGGWRPARVRRTGDGGEFMGVRTYCLYRVTGVLVVSSCRPTRKPSIIKRSGAEGLRSAAIPRPSLNPSTGSFELAFLSSFKTLPGPRP